MEEDSLCPGYKHIGGRRLEALVPLSCEGLQLLHMPLDM